MEERKITGKFHHYKVPTLSLYPLDMQELLCANTRTIIFKLGIYDLETEERHLIIGIILIRQVVLCA